MSPPVRSTGVHHVDLVVSSIERSLPFYRDLLAPLGYHGISEVEGERGETIYYLWGPGTLDRPARGADASTAGRTTATRSASTTSRSRRRRARPSTSGRAGSARPAPRSRAGRSEYAYQLGYYAVFFYDPDGIKLEIVHIPRHAA